VAASGRSGEAGAVSADLAQRTIVKASRRKIRILRKSVAACQGV